MRFAVPNPAPLVSIIIPTRDRADLLGQCIDSLLAQTRYANYEVIIVDNGSVAIRDFLAVCEVAEGQDTHPP